MINHWRLPFEAILTFLIAFRYEETMVNSIAFTTFVINVAMEGLCEKYGDEVNLDRQNWVILKNKKYLGNLQRHHIQQVSRIDVLSAEVYILPKSKPSFYTITPS